ncbi:MAG: single-stranded-DNA-specific exonuclease RecJ [Lachnospiraceae bacterium]|nr:single-stranded-DNA-specific exonuclease RecJ [Lachnospiraceae bacterium]
MKRWVVAAKKADFNGIAKRFSITPMLARILRNRDVITDEEIAAFLNGSIEDLHDPMLLYGMDMAVSLIDATIQGGGKIRVVGDYDVDGISATYILVRTLQACGADVSWQLPERLKDGYGLNRNIIGKANDDRISLLLTCDNGIAAVEEIAYAKELGMCVVVTDHHEPREILPPADAIVDPKQPACTYPDTEICGAVVAYKLSQALCKKKEIHLPEGLLQFAAFATVCDVMPLLKENRIIVQCGMREMAHTDNTGLAALIDVTGCDRSNLSPYHLGFILGPCVNATGRLDEATRALNLFLSKDIKEAAILANTLKELNEQRKEKTLFYTKKAIDLVGTGDGNNPVLAGDNVLVIYLPDCHESIAGIVAGKVKEHYYKPTIVLTDSEDPGIVKGSGRSIEGYGMFDALCAVSDVFVKFGGHKMAAGMSLKQEKIDELRRRLNENETLSEEDLTEKVLIDIAMPLPYVTAEFVDELERLNPYGVGNPRPVFAQKGLKIREMSVCGEKKNVVRLRFEDQVLPAVYFGDGEAFEKEYGIGDPVMIAYTPEWNVYRGNKSLQIQVKEIKPDT